MDLIVPFLMNLIPFLIVLSILVYVHELGHYLVAIKNGVRVDVFSIGFGPEIFGWTNKKNTRWKISLIPLGGYVKLANEEDMFHDADRQKLEKKMPEDSLLAKSVGQRIAISAAGPGANYLFAIVLLGILYTIFGQRHIEPGVLVNRTIAAGAAEKAGILPDDHIKKINGQIVESLERLQKEIAASPDKQILLTIARQGKQQDLPILVANDNGKGRIGIEMQPIVTMQKHGFFSAVYHALKDTWTISAQTVINLGEMLTGSRSADGLSGPIGIANLVGSVAQKGFVDLLFLAALLSINLGLINLFPIPVLDGGHILLYIMEGLRGKPVPEKIQNIAFNLGFGLMAFLFLYTSWNDLMRLQAVQKLLQLFGIN